MAIWRLPVTAIGFLLLGLVATLNAADLKKALAETEGRARAAHNGATTINAKSPQQAGQARAVYVEAADAQNAWRAATDLANRLRWKAWDELQ